MAEPISVRSLSVYEYHAMAEAGILSEDERVELIDGQIIEKMTIGPKHIRIVNLLNELVVKNASEVVEVSVQNPLRLGRYTEPEPDVVLLRRERDMAAVPQAKDALLVVEVAETSLDFDRRIKLPRYAAAGVPEVWIVDITDRCIEGYREPAGDEYKARRVFHEGETIQSQTVPKLGTIDIDAVFS